MEEVTNSQEYVDALQKIMTDKFSPDKFEYAFSRVKKARSKN